MADKKLAAMHQEFGRAYGMKCIKCPLLKQDRRPCKCKAYGVSMSAATDWSPALEACGLCLKAELPEGFVPLFDRIKRRKRPDNTPIEGQLDMFGGVVGD